MPGPTENPNLSNPIPGCGRPRYETPMPQLSAHDLAQLFHRHGEPLAGMVRAVAGRGADPAEVVQEAFLKAWRGIERGHRPDDPKAWVFTVTLNQARDIRRREARRAARSLPISTAMNPAMNPEGTRDPAPDPLAQMVRVEALEAAQSAIEALDDGEKDVFLLRVAGDLSFRDAALALGIPEGTAKTRMRTALARLRRDLRWFAPDAAATHPDQPDQQRKNR